MAGRSPEEIRRDMAALRTEMGEGMNEIAEGAREMSDWRYYVRQYPWLAVGAAAALGYMFVPQRLELIRPDPKALMELAEKNRVLIKPKPEVQPRGPGAAMFSFLMNAAMRSAVVYAGQRVGKILQESSGNNQAVKEANHGSPQRQEKRTVAQTNQPTSQHRSPAREPSKSST